MSTIPDRREVQTLLAHASVRDRVLIWLCHERKLRIEDAVTLKWKEVKLKRGMLLRYSLSPRLSPHLLQALQALPQGELEKPIVGVSQTAARQRLKALAQKAGVAYRGCWAF